MAEQNRNSGPLATIVLIVVLALAGWFGFVYEIPKKAAEPAGTTAESAPAAETPAADLSETAPGSASSDAAAQPDGAAPAAAEAAPGGTEASGGGATASSGAASDATAEALQTATQTSPADAESAPAPEPSSQAAATAPSNAPGGDGTPASETSTLAGPTFDVVRVEPSGETVAAGLAEPKATVELLDGAQPIARTEANERGEWTVLLDKPLAPGTHDLGIRTISPDGRTESLSEQRVAVDVPEKAGEQPLVVLNTPEEPSRVLQAPEPVTETGGAETAQAPTDAAASSAAGGAEAEPAAPSSSNGTDTAADTGAPADFLPQTAAGEPPAPSADTEAAPAAEAPSAIAADGETPAAPVDTPAPAAIASEPKVAVEAVEIENGRLYVAGSASGPETVRVYVDDQPVGEAKPDENGRWILEANRDLDPGQHAVRADQVGADGQVIVRAEVDFLREPDTVALAPVVVSPGAAGGGAAGATVDVAMPQTQTVIIRRGDNLWRIARRLYGRGIRYTTIYSANDDQIRSPHRIYPGQVFVVPAGDLRWTN
ncbi:LysM peptidoglycan-binding domain-containing protein [Prosthecomicrobium pneumaticum]|uniref:Nucleoid-associated protein YgaU n=1 Tax=Prosthecomicrobium pneumaticum TaxID=81895 RepID=A0A7W9CSP2_9HYPH|nr:LysM peptidoglycan-binding domain-containing protein [Prosthecomicrobium pneumaticum]MBB5751193.1 nucleoid-associated protein YgaU [Prosthecomicrobium pneumaticum]